MSIAPTTLAGRRVTPAIFPTMSAGVTNCLRPTLRKIVFIPGSRPVRAGRSYLDFRAGASADSSKSGAAGAGAAMAAGTSVRSATSGRGAACTAFGFT